MSGDSHPYVPIHDEEPVDEANQSYNNFRITDEPPFSSRRINQNNNKNRCYNFLSSKYFLFGILLVLIVFIIAMGYLLFQKLDTEIIELKAELSSYRSQTDRNFIALTTNLDNFKDKENDFEVLATKKIVDTNKIFQTQNKTLSGNINRIFSTIELHQKELDRLSNGTSNADVLDQLRATKKAVDNDLDDALSKVDKRLRKNADEIEKTEVQIKEDLDNAMDRMKLVVEKSTNHIKDIQQNVTNELDFMSVKLVATVQELNKEVNTAKGIIQSEVADVKGNIEQYVIVTNKQFAAENDFVKYQLAGTASVFEIVSFSSFYWVDKCKDCHRYNNFINY